MKDLDHRDSAGTVMQIDAVNAERNNGPVDMESSAPVFSVPLAPRRVRRRANGTVLPGEQLAFKNGSRARLPIESRELVAADLESAILADLGGEANVGTVLRQAVRRYSRLSAACEHVETELATHGALTRSYAVRRNVDYLLKLNASALAWARVIGTNRKTKDIGDLNIETYLASQRQERSE